MLDLAEHLFGGAPAQVDQLGHVSG